MSIYGRILVHAHTTFDLACALEKLAEQLHRIELETPHQTGPLLLYYNGLPIRALITGEPTNGGADGA